MPALRTKWKGSMMLGALIGFLAGLATSFLLAIAVAGEAAS